MNDTVTAAQLMSGPVIAVTTEHSLAVAWETMRQRRVHHVAVLAEDGLSAVLDAVTLAGHWPAGGPEAPHEHRVGEVVTHGVRCADPDDPATEVARLMVDGGCDAVPVVTATGVLLGLVTATDIVAAVARGTVVVPGPGGVAA